MTTLTRPQALAFVHAHLMSGHDVRVRPDLTCPACGTAGPISFWIIAKHNPEDVDKQRRWLAAHCRCGCCWVAQLWRRGRRLL